MPDQNIFIQISIIYCMVHMYVLLLLLYEHRGSKRAFWIGLVCIFTVTSSICLWIMFTQGIAAMGQWGVLIASVPTLIYFFIMSRQRNAQFVFLFCFCDTVCMWIELTTGLIDYAVGGGGVVTLVLRLVTLPLLEYAVWRWLRRPFLEMSHMVRKGWLLFAILTGVCYLILVILSVYPTNLLLRPQDMPLAVMVLALIALAYCTIFLVLFEQLHVLEAQERQRAFELQSAMVEQRVTELQSAEERFRVERHDLKHRLLTIAELLQKNDVDEALNYIGASQQALDATAVEHYCDHPALDAILNSYFRQAKELGVQLDAHIDLPKELPVSTADLSTVFANALENMLHAMEKLPVEERRMVCKCVATPCLMMEFSNPCGEDVCLGPDGLPIAHSPGHGVGTRSIAAFAEKYGAICTFRVENGWFRLRIAL